MQVGNREGEASGGGGDGSKMYIGKNGFKKTVFSFMKASQQKKYKNKTQLDSKILERHTLLFFT